MTECLHCQINELVHKHIDENETVDLGDVAARVAGCLADLVLLAPEATCHQNVRLHGPSG
jgi:hypothetical protein